MVINYFSLAVVFIPLQIINGYLKLLAFLNGNCYVIISQTMTSIVNRVAITQRFHMLSKVRI